MLGIGGTS